MKKINYNFLFPLGLLLILTYSLSIRMFGCFPIGKFFDPFAGVFQNGRAPGPDTESRSLRASGLKDSVNVFFDERMIPHIYAKNDADLYFAQGYIAASLRLWQMDFLTYVAAGRLSEIMEKGYVDYDRSQRRQGFLQAAKNALNDVKKDSQSYSAIRAYSQGVNAFIAQLDYKHLPVEYKLLDYKPEPWSDLKSVLIMKYMAGLLSGYDEDWQMTNLMLTLGQDNFNDLFPDMAGYTRKPAYLDHSFLSATSTVVKNPYNPRLGSNSWVVSGNKTASGFPILACDPHLNLSLPCIWVEMQLSAPGQNVYGVAIPGVPAIVIGFNQHIAWGLTNGQDDVKDWYKLKITDDYKKYELDGKWLDLGFRIEEIKRRGQSPLLDTVFYTIHGPVVSTKGYPGTNPGLMNYALNWELQNPSDEILTFLQLNKAVDYAEFKQAIRHYSSPTQNFTVACQDNTIAVHHQGNLHEKWPEQGKFILDGTQSRHLYRSYIPFDSLPYRKDPACNYVLSANQRPTDSTYPYYYNGYYSVNRALRIDQLLKNDDRFTIAKMQTMQTDNTDVFALQALPVLIRILDTARLDPASKGLAREFAAWNGAFDRDSKQAALFVLWWNNVRKMTWDEFDELTFEARYPDDQVLLRLMDHEPSNKYFDRQGTSAIETAPDIVREAFRTAAARYDTLKRTESILWAPLNKVNLTHMLNLDAFSVTGLPSSGHPEAINAMSRSWGPSWRMIVELGKRPRAVGIYPGGQSGDVGSPHYDDFVKDWNHGNYYPLTYFVSQREAQMNSIFTWSLY